MNIEGMITKTNDKNLKSILDFDHFVIIQTAFLGDTTLTFYLCQFIKNYFKKHNKECKITFVTIPAWLDLVKEVKSIDNIILYDKKNKHKSILSTLQIAKEINNLKPDCIISPHKSTRTSILVKFINAKYKIGYDIANLSFVYNYKSIYQKNNHEIVRILSLLNGFREFANIKFNNEYLATVSKVDILDKVDNEDLKRVTRDENNVKEISNFISNSLTNNEFIIIAPGSVWATKKWNSKYYAELISLIISKYPKFKIIITGGKADIDTSNEIMSHLKNINNVIFDNPMIEKNNIFDLTNKTSLDLSLFLFSKSILTITNDSAPTHISELVNKNVLTIYGPTSPKFGFSPRLINSAYIQLENLDCKPCHIHGKNVCPIGTHICMNLLKPDVVFEKVNELLANILEKD